MRGDSILALTLLDGFIQNNENGLPEQHYLAETKEDEGRRALARLLRSDAPLDRHIRHTLAALFEPNDVTDEHGRPWPYVPNSRQLKFEFRSKKRRPDHVRNSAIAQYVNSRIKGDDSVEKTIANAAEKFDLSEDTIKTIWRKYRWAKHLGLL